METFDELFYREPFTREFKAKVMACTPANGKFEIELTDTAFYPEGGGQPGDRGTLVLLDENGQPIAAPGKKTDVAAAETPAAPAVSDASTAPGTDSPAIASATQTGNKAGTDDATTTDSAKNNADVETSSPEETEAATPDPAIHVLDTQKHGDAIVQITDAPLPVGSQVRGNLDWTWRRDNMEAHTGEHVVSGIVHALYGYNNVGFHMGDRCIEVDFDGVLTEEQALDVERRANAAVREDVPVNILLPSAEELAAMDYRSKKELEGPVRIVEIPGVDECACCGTHVATTGQVGLIKVLRVTTKKKKTRLELLCGRRALEAVEDEQASLQATSNFLSVGNDETLDAVKRLSAEKDELKHELKQAHRQAIDQEIAGLAVKAAQSNPSPKLLLQFKPTFEVDEQRYFCEQALGQNVAQACAVLSEGTGKQAGRVNYVIASADKGPDLRATCKELNKRLQGRGGGKPHMVQGSYAAALEEIEAALRELLG